VSARRAWFPRAITEDDGSGAAYLPEEIRLKFGSLLNAMVPVAQGWGMTECVGTEAVLMFYHG
jgi:long-subunit acyl-CoA synthetase (AMP-forming)